jgi:hypothetical protein
VPISLEPVDQGLFLPDGRRLGIVAPVLSPADIERARAGYLCLKCLEPFEHAWPERCAVCGAPIRKEQAAYLAREFEQADLARPSVDDELAELHERRAKEERNGS